MLLPSTLDLQDHLQRCCCIETVHRGRVFYGYKLMRRTAEEEKRKKRLLDNGQVFHPQFTNGLGNQTDRQGAEL